MAEAETKYTAREVEIMAAVLQSLKDGAPKQSQIDIPKLAAKVGMTEGSASVTWGKIKKKLIDEDANGTMAPPKTPATGENKANKETPASSKRKSTGGKKGANGEDVENGDKDETTETPTKKSRGRPAVKTKAKAATPKDEDEEEKIEMKDIETPAKPPAKKKAASKKVKASPKASTPSSELAGDDAGHEPANGESVTAEVSGQNTIEVETTNGTTVTVKPEQDDVEEARAKEEEEANTC